ncbi:MAG: 16S rRNA (uracil(1498)-N(3))-methyltransferase [Gammaproteobacteria bacterium]|nr:16S rRNA (uracil(1498)-N(3))-methyltransferase [Gammaproteobacteria bacterium]
MQIPRIYCPQALSLNTSIQLDADSARRLSQVLRLKKGATVILFNGDGSDYTAQIIEINKSNTMLEVKQQATLHTESRLKLHLGQGISRGERMDFCVQKSVELGATSITPLFTEYCQVKLTGARLEKRLQHWQGIAKHAAEQSARANVPTIHKPVLLEDWFGQAAGLKLICEPTAAATLTGLQQIPSEISLLVGPEGGFSDAEIQAAITASFQAIKFGPRILRTESAAMVAMSLLQYRWGDLS